MLKTICMAAGGALVFGASAGAQQACGGDAVRRGHLGVEIACDCTLPRRPDAGRPWTFRGPIEVVGVEPAGPAHEVLQSGDRIVAVNGVSITTLAGATHLSQVAPGNSLTLSIERGGLRMERRLVATSICSDDPRAWGAYAPQFPRQTTASVRQPAGGGQRAAGAVPMLPDLYPRGWLGFALACRRCGWARAAGDEAPYWESAAPPTVHAVEPGGPAARAGLVVGDVVTHASGLEITTTAGGRALGAVQPNERVRLRVRRGAQIRDIDILAGNAPSTSAQAERLLYIGRIGGVEVSARGAQAATVTSAAADGQLVITLAGTVIVLRDTRGPAPR